jgi:hypothetical protein
MDPGNQEKRREPRFPIETEVTLQRTQGAEPINSVSTNLSGAGMHVQVPESAAIRIGEVLTCDVALPSDAQHGLATWGAGRVVRIDESGAAIELEAALFEEPRSSHDPLPE